MREWLLRTIVLREAESPPEERASGLTHGLGALLAIAGTLALTARMADTGRPALVIASLVYGVSMIVLYSASAAYHLVEEALWKRLLRVLDHVSIYFLIAGTYTPITLGLGGRLGWLIFGAVWSMAAIGIVFTFFFWGRLRWLHVLLYLATGWVIVIAWKPVVAALPDELYWWALGGGVVYSLGAAIYAIRRVRFYHAIWHLFVLGGSVCFYAGIYRNVPLMPGQ
ncbi:MAG: hemolysin III family protein [Deltaproteobacteria bacterium]|nr:hemolysin III family protein [Deltaproteobacteria bacterium]